jgi:hypothetical protein
MVYLISFHVASKALHVIEIWSLMAWRVGRMTLSATLRTELVHKCVPCSVFCKKIQVKEKHSKRTRLFFFDL